MPDDNHHNHNSYHQALYRYYWPNLMIDDDTDSVHCHCRSTFLDKCRHKLAMKRVDMVSMAVLFLHDKHEPNPIILFCLFVDYHRYLIVEKMVPKIQ